MVHLQVEYVAIIIQNYLDTLLQRQILAKKANGIFKTADLIDAVLYSFNDPYYFSV